MNKSTLIRKVPIITRPVDPHGPVLHCAAEIETLRFLRKRPLAEIRIQVARHKDGLWMWSASIHSDTGYSGYCVGPKWGKFARTHADALAAACNETIERARSLPRDAIEWLTEICGAKQRQMELFQ